MSQSLDLLPQLIQQRHAASEEEKAAKAVKDLLSQEISQIMEANELTETIQSGIKCQRIQGKTASKLDEKLLLANGVEADIIKASTTEGKTYTYIQTKTVEA